MGFDKRFMVMAAALAGCGALVAVGHMQQPVGFGSVLELWGDVLRDVDQAGLKLAPAAPDEEMRLGDELSKGVWGVAPLQTEDSLKVDRIGQRLVPFVRRGAIRYHFAVVDSPEINAFALPGGRVFVTNGMLGFVQSDDELASVIGHEMAHVDLRHCIERYQVALKARKLHLGDLGEVVQASGDGRGRRGSASGAGSRIRPARRGPAIPENGAASRRTGVRCGRDAIRRGNVRDGTGALRVLPFASKLAGAFRETEQHYRTIICHAAGRTSCKIFVVSGSFLIDRRWVAAIDSLQSISNDIQDY